MVATGAGMRTEGITSAPYDGGLTALVRILWRAGHSRHGEVRATDMIGRAMRGRIRGLGLQLVPIGDSDAKTASPGTYREVGLTCPSTCRYLGNGCYALGGNVAIHQRNAGNSVNAALHGAAAAMVWAALTGRVARLHVSGDLGTSVDADYVAGLVEVGREVRRLSGNAVVAWSYTHHADGPYRAELADAGIVVRLSDRTGPSGAIVVASREHAREVRAASGAPVAVCPAQLRDVSCAECRLCWTRPDVTIAFIAHGMSAAKVGAMVRE